MGVFHAYIYRCAGEASSLGGDAPSLGGDASSPGGDASPRLLKKNQM